jgi:hypothetical protein
MVQWVVEHLHQIKCKYEYYPRIAGTSMQLLVIWNFQEPTSSKGKNLEPCQQMIDSHQLT